MANEKNLFAGPRGKHVAAAGTVVAHSHSPAREIEHGQTQGLGLARAGGRPKATGHVPVHPASHRVTGTTLGASKIETLSSIPDASNPNVLDPTKTKRYPAPAIAWGNRSRGSVAHDPNLGEAILREALGGSDDFARGHIGHLPGASK
jgi:hypothetical protein